MHVSTSLRTFAFGLPPLARLITVFLAASVASSAHAPVRRVLASHASYSRILPSRFTMSLTTWPEAAR